MERGQYDYRQFTKYGIGDLVYHVTNPNVVMVIIAISVYQNHIKYICEWSGETEVTETPFYEFELSPFTIN